MDLGERDVSVVSNVFVRDGEGHGWIRWNRFTVKQTRENRLTDSCHEGQNFCFKLENGVG